MSTTSQDQNNVVVNLTDLVAEPFYRVYWSIIDNVATYFELAGGRGSTKSSFVSVMIVLGIMEDENANGIVFRKVANTLRESVYEQILWAIDSLNVGDYWECRVSPMQCVYKPTGQKITFRGLDKAKKLKSIKVSKGYFKFLWFEELDEFSGEQEIRNVQQSVLRGGSKYVVFKTFNPPISRSNWANVSFDTQKDDCYKHRSTYLDVEPDWLGQQFINDAEHLRDTNEKAYRHEFLGEPVGIGTTIFDDIEIVELTDERVNQFERIYQGQDWGWYPDPKAFVRLNYNPNNETITILDELGGCKIRNKDMADKIVEHGFDDNIIYCGSDEPQSIADYRDNGILSQNAWTAPNSVRYTHEWLQCRKIQIDPNRTPCLYKEMIEYEHEVDDNGNVMSAYPDKNNHYIDAMRYAISHIAKRRGESA